MVRVRLRVIHGIDDLANDMRGITANAPRELRGVVREGITAGAKVARANAQRSAGAHGKHYPKSITSEMHAGLSGEYGPDAAMPQGGMSFEFGSRNQPPHLDLAKSADLIGPKFEQKVDQKVGGWFW